MAVSKCLGSSAVAWEREKEDRELGRTSMVLSFMTVAHGMTLHDSRRGKTRRKTSTDSSLSENQLSS